MGRLGLFFLLLTAPLSASDFRFTAAFTPEDFRELAQVLGDAVAFPHLTTARPSGVSGFEVLGVVGGPQASEGEHWFRHGLTTSTTLGVLPARRVLVRKGLPKGVDVGAQVGKVVGASFWGAEGRVALFSGGLVLPALALRGSFSTLTGAPVDLWTAQVDLLVSKGFVLFAPFGGVGYRFLRASAFFGDPAPRTHSVSEARATAVVGVVVRPLPLLRVVAEGWQGKKRILWLGVGVGF